VRAATPQSTYPLESVYMHALLVRAPREFPRVSLFRRNVGAVRLEGRYFRAGIEGQADLYGIGRGGRHYEIEVKRFTELSRAQKRWRAWCLEHEVPWIMIRVRPSELLPVQTIERWVVELMEFFACN
jgi:hypothetical protein